MITKISDALYLDLDKLIAWHFSLDGGRDFVEFLIEGANKWFYADLDDATQLKKLLIEKYEAGLK